MPTVFAWRFCGLRLPCFHARDRRAIWPLAWLYSLQVCLLRNPSIAAQVEPHIESNMHAQLQRFIRICARAHTHGTRGVCACVPPCVSVKTGRACMYACIYCSVDLMCRDSCTRTSNIYALAMRWLTLCIRKRVLPLPENSNKEWIAIAFARTSL